MVLVAGWKTLVSGGSVGNLRHLPYLPDVQRQSLPLAGRCRSFSLGVGVGDLWQRGIERSVGCSVAVVLWVWLSSSSAT
jgi:hypothetical protein